MRGMGGGRASVVFAVACLLAAVVAGWLALRAGLPVPMSGLTAPTGLGAWVLAVAAVLIAGASAYYLLAGLSVLSVFVRGGLALLPIGIAAAGGIWLVLTYMPANQPTWTAAAITAVSVAAGWVVTYVSTEWRAANQEQERRRDLIRAALVEVELIVSFAVNAKWEGVTEATKQEFDRDRRYQVFVPYGHQFMMLRRLVTQIEVLRTRQIRPVMDFFQLLDRIEQIEKSMATAQFAALSWQRRQSLVLRYIELQVDVRLVGKDAADALNSLDYPGLLSWLK